MNDKLQKAKWIISTLRSAGFETMIVGGAVRDHYMGLSPKDLDIATEARPEQVESLFSHTISVGKQFGVILVIVEKDSFEVATFRKDFHYSDGRHPDKVEFASAREDVLRRDFTINGLFWDPDKDEIHDWVDGCRDIDNKIIRCIGNPHERFQEDRLRILRAVRFASNLDFEIEPQTWEAVCDPRYSLDRISKERIRIEFEKILTRSHAAKGLALLQKSGLVEYVISPFCYPPGALWPDSLIKSFEEETLWQMEEALALIYGASEKMFAFQNSYYRLTSFYPSCMRQVKKFLKEMTFCNKTIEGCMEILEILSQFFKKEEWPLSLIRRQMGRIWGRQAFDVLKRFERFHHDCKRKSPAIEKVLESFTKNPLLPQPIITGDTLLTHGFKPGPVFSSVLSELYDIQLSDPHADHQMLLRRLEKIKKEYEKNVM
ncbi:MAG: CCA tRNA nucleotidyltransferase [Candidatus Aureabacteria bacterium]|nr:CCA tRNA nucleotidyltransferase [Candidatus Auribacterota bacterium]